MKCSIQSWKPLNFISFVCFFSCCKNVHLWDCFKLLLLFYYLLSAWTSSTAASPEAKNQTLPEEPKGETLINKKFNICFVPLI